MVRSDHQPLTGIGDGVLSNHAHPRLGVTQHEITLFRAQRLECFGSGRQTQYRGADVHRVAFIGLDGIHRQLSFMLVMLDLIRQAHGDETVVVSLASGAHPSTARCAKRPAVVESTPPLIPSTSVFMPDSRRQDWMKRIRRSISVCTDSGPVKGAQTWSAAAISC